MLKSFLAAAALAAGALTFAPNASAVGFSIVNAVDGGRTRSTTDIVGGGLCFSIGSLSLALDPGTLATVTYTFLGKEASWNNAFFTANQSFAFDNMSPRARFRSDALATGGMLDFGFRIGQDGPMLDNASNGLDGVARFGIALDRGGLSGLLLLDDGGAGPDGDWDDMLVRFNVGIQPVPEPSTWALMALGLLGLGVVTRRRSNAAARG